MKVEYPITLAEICQKGVSAEPNIIGHKYFWIKEMMSWQMEALQNNIRYTIQESFIVPTFWQDKVGSADDRYFFQHWLQAQNGPFLAMVRSSSADGLNQEKPKSTEEPGRFYSGAIWIDPKNMEKSFEDFRTQREKVYCSAHGRPMAVGLHKVLGQPQLVKESFIPKNTVGLGHVSFYTAGQSFSLPYCMSIAMAFGLGGILGNDPEQVDFLYFLKDDFWLQHLLIYNSKYAFQGKEIGPRQQEAEVFNVENGSLELHTFDVVWKKYFPRKKIYLYELTRNPKHQSIVIGLPLSIAQLGIIWGLNRFFSQKAGGLTLNLEGGWIPGVTLPDLWQITPIRHPQEYRKPFSEINRSLLIGESRQCIGSGDIQGPLIWFWPDKIDGDSVNKIARLDEEFKNEGYILLAPSAFGNNIEQMARHCRLRVTPKPVINETTHTIQALLHRLEYGEDVFFMGLNRVNQGLLESMPHESRMLFKIFRNVKAELRFDGGRLFFNQSLSEDNC